MTSCCLCGLPCVPMADWDRPVCPRCDRDHETALLRAVSTPVDDKPPAPRNPGLEALAAAVTAATYGRRVPEYHNAARRLLDDMDTPRLRVIDGGAA